MICIYEICQCYSIRQIVSIPDQPISLQQYYSSWSWNIWKKWCDIFEQWVDSTWSWFHKETKKAFIYNTELQHKDKRIRIKSNYADIYSVTTDHHTVTRVKNTIRSKLNETKTEDYEMKHHDTNHWKNINYWAKINFKN